MRLRTRHAAHAGFEVTRPDDTEHGTAPTSADLQDCLVAVLGVEVGDDRVRGLAAATAAAVRERADTLNTDRVLLVPDPTLVARGADDDVADALTAETADALTEDGADEFEVVRAPAGTYVALRIEPKAHPFADETQRIEPAPVHPNVAERVVVTPDGSRRDPATADVAEGIDEYCSYVTDSADGSNGGRHRLLDDVSAAGLASTGSDETGPGVSWTPTGTVVREAITALLTDRFAAAGATPVVAGRSGPGESQPSPRLGLRAAVADAVTDWADLPARLFDGEHETPAMVTATAPGEDGLTAFVDGVELAAEACETLGIGDVVVVRLAADAPVDTSWATRLADRLDRPLVVERVDPAVGGPAVEVVRYATSGVDTPVELGRVRLDTAGWVDLDAAFGSADEDENDHPWLVTTEPVGPLSVAVAAILADRRGAADPPLPTWLAPTQVRLLPISPTHEAECVDVATTLRAAGVRADVDDRDRTVAARLDAADGVPYVAVVGDREVDGAALKVTMPDGAETTLPVERLRERVDAAVGDRPRTRPRLAVRMSERTMPRVGRADGGGDSER